MIFNEEDISEELKKELAEDEKRSSITTPDGLVIPRHNYRIVPWGMPFDTGVVGSKGQWEINFLFFYNGKYFDNGFFALYKNGIGLFSMFNKICDKLANTICDHDDDPHLLLLKMIEQEWYTNGHHHRWNHLYVPSDYIDYIEYEEKDNYDKILESKLIK